MSRALRAGKATLLLAGVEVAPINSAAAAEEARRMLDKAAGWYGSITGTFKCPVVPIIETDKEIPDMLYELIYGKRRYPRRGTLTLKQFIKKFKQRRKR